MVDWIDLGRKGNEPSDEKNHSMRAVHSGSGRQNPPCDVVFYSLPSLWHGNAVVGAYMCMHTHSYTDS